MEEVRRLRAFVIEQSGVVSEEMGGKETVDVKDLINVVMDTSLDAFEGANAKPVDRYSMDKPGSRRPSQDYRQPFSVAPE